VSDFDATPYDSPYAPPKADLHGLPSGGPMDRPPGVDSGDPSKVDPAIALQFPFQHPGWWKPALLLGVVYLVPIYGIVLMMGWIQDIYNGVRAGTLERLPDVDWSGHFSGGLRLTGSLLVGSLIWTFLMMGAMGLFFLFGAGLEAAGQSEAAAISVLIGTFVIQLPMIALMFASYFVGGELGRRALNGDLFALMRWKRSIQVIIAHPMSYIITLAGLFAAMMAMYTGIFACYFGFLVTMPLGAAMAAHMLAQWDRHLDHLDSPHRH